MTHNASPRPDLGRPELDRPSPGPSGLEFPQVLSILRRAALPILGVTALAGIGAYLLSSAQPKVYEASSSLFSEQSAGGNSALNDSVLRPPPLPRGALEQALHSPAVVGLVINRLRAAEVAPQTVSTVEGELRSELSTGGFGKLNVQADGDGQSGVFTLRARANTPALARSLANAGVSALQLWDIQRAQRRLEQSRVGLKMQLDLLDRSAQDGQLSTDAANNQARAGIVRDLVLIDVSRQSVAGTLEVIAEAVEPAAPMAPRPKRTALLAALLTLLFAGGGAVLLASRRRSLVEWDSVPGGHPQGSGQDAGEAHKLSSTAPQR